MKIFKNIFIQSLLSFILLLYFLVSGFIQPLFQKLFQASSIYSDMFVGFGLFLFAVIWIIVFSFLLCFFHVSKIKSFFKIFITQIVLLIVLIFAYFISLKNQRIQSLELIKKDQNISQKMQQLPLLDPDRPLTILNMVETDFKGIHLESNKSYRINVRLSPRLNGQNLVGKVYAFLKDKVGRTEVFRFAFSRNSKEVYTNVWSGEIKLIDVSRLGSEGVLDIEVQDFNIHETVSVFFVHSL